MRCVLCHKAKEMSKFDPVEWGECAPVCHTCNDRPPSAKLSTVFLCWMVVLALVAIIFTIKDYQ